MEKFTIAIEETLVEEFDVVAESETEALEIAFHKYKNHDFVLENGEVQYSQMAIVNPNINNIDWVEI